MFVSVRKKRKNKDGLLQKRILFKSNQLAFWLWQDAKFFLNKFLHFACQNNDISACCNAQIYNHVGVLRRYDRVTAAQCSFDTNFIKIVSDKNYSFVINFQC